MADFVSLSCPSCGAKLQISKDLDRFACSYCGNEHIVKRDGGVISLSPVMEQLKGVRTGVDKTASELAIRRLRQEIDGLKSKRDAIKGEGCLSMVFSGGGLMTLGITGFLIAVMFGSFVTYIESSTALGFVVVFAVIVIVIAGVIDFNSGKEASEQRDVIQKVISKKQAELENHEKIVSGE